MKPGSIHGGKREGAGAKSLPPDRKKHLRSFKADDALWKRAQEAAKRHGVSASEFTRQCLLAGIEQEEFRQSKGAA